jgi:hypothetical protein
MHTKLFSYKVKKLFAQAIQYTQTDTTTAQIWLFHPKRQRQRHTHTHTLVEEYGETDLLKKEEKQAGHNDNGSIMFLEMETQFTLRLSALFTRTGEGEGNEEERHNILKSAWVYNKNMEETNADNIPKRKRTKYWYKMIFCHLINMCT